MKNYGYIQVYTGTGKGKTTAALGVSLRTLIHGGKVYFGQFIKGGDKFRTAELSLSEKYPGFTIKQFGKGCCICRNPDPEDIRLAESGLKEVSKALKSGEYDLVVLDEVNNAVSIGLLDADSVLQAVNERAEGTEVILTGRNAPAEFIGAADLITEMTADRHYIEKGVSAREGIEY